MDSVELSERTINCQQRPPLTLWLRLLAWLFTLHKGPEGGYSNEAAIIKMAYDRKKIDPHDIDGT